MGGDGAIKRGYLANIISTFEKIIFNKNGNKNGSEPPSDKDTPDNNGRNANVMNKSDKGPSVGKKMAREAGKREQQNIVKDWRHGLLFKTLFGMLSTTYFKTFDWMLIVNTEDNLNGKVSESALLNSNMVKVSLPKTGNWYRNWFKNGETILKKLSSCKLTVRYENRSGDGTFKAIY